MSLAIENHCNIDYECLNMLIKVAENLQKEFKSVVFKLVGQKEIVDDLRILTSQLNIHSNYFRKHNYNVLKPVENYLFKQDYFVFERITPLLKFKYNRGAANEIIKYFNNYAHKENIEYKKRLTQLLLLTGSDRKIVKTYFISRNNKNSNSKYLPNSI
ncbi:6828_t:CDS:1 [Dentiscutata heterogama]|uniref:6828_t:CDS:1 n=1 Tax=Dentiscutata heterogama TaxID=1316150 RepID=A0ACA9K4X3_9GLOM|nr:6828_t:CDS:1 [Dentiscutata heterogama]